MEQSFDKFGQYEYPNFILCNPDKSELFSLGGAIYDTQIVLKFNAISEFSFSYPKSIDGGETQLEAYDYLQNKRLILISGYGYFQITNSTEDLDGATPIKNVKCQSLEVELIQKRVSIYGGTKPLWNILDSAGTILQDMINLAPNWSIGTISSELLTKYRTFDVSDTNVYEFLMNEVAPAFECVFIFDTVNREINAYTIEDATTQTDIFLSFNNIISKANFSEKSDEITTSLSVFGDGNLNINLVNPLGSTRIYDFSYYKSTNWMSQGLVDAITAWENLVDIQQPIYSSNLVLLQTYNGELLVLQSDLATLNTEYLALDGQKGVLIQANGNLTAINTQLLEKQNQIDAQNILIDNKQTQIDDTTLDLQAINTLVSFESNFTSPQLLELNNFIFENTYRNNNIIQTDSMSIVEVQDQAQELYNQGVEVLSKISQPRYEFDLDAINYVSLEEFGVFTSQTELGCIVTCEIKDGSYIETVLLELSFQFDNPEDFSMKFSNRLRLDDGKFTYSDLMGQVVSTGSDVSFDSSKWANWENNYKDPVSTFITSSLNATVNNLISSESQDILINQNGLRARQSDGSGGFDGKQAWLVNNVLAFSDDGFQTAKLALGEITLPEGGTAYGLVADTIIGRLLAGNTLTITNEGNNFVLDSTGATLTNAKFSIQTTNTKIIIDPTASLSFRIQKNEGGTFNDKFWVDNTGNVNFSGTLSGANGTFSGTLSANVGNIGTLVIDSNGLKTSDGQNYLRGNGSLKWGGLTISGSSASFDGTIYANNISGQVVNGQIASGFDAGKVTFGSMSGSRLFGGTPTVSGINPTGSTISVGGSISAAGFVAAGTGITASGTTSLATLIVGGSLVVSGGSGISITVTVTTPFGTRYLGFSRGVLVSYSS